MNTTENNNNPSSLQEHLQRKHALEAKRNKWTGMMIALLFVPLVIQALLEHYLPEDTITRLIGIMYLCLLLFEGYFIVKVTKWTWAINDVEREIKKIEKQHGVIPGREKTAIIHITTHHPTWSERLARALGFIMIIITLCFVTIMMTKIIDLVAYGLPQLIVDDLFMISLGSIWTGQNLLQYRSDMGPLCRIAIWIAAALLSVTVLLYFNECKVASSMMLLTLIIGVAIYTESTRRLNPSSKTVTATDISVDKITGKQHHS